MNLAETTWTDAEATDTDLAVLPVGSTEQHGPHGPLGTDFLAAEAVAEAALASYDRDVMQAPVVPVGVSEEHRQFTGTLWVSPDSFRSYVREVVESLLSHGWNRVVIVNGHGGNAAAIGEVASRVSRAEDALVVPFTWFDAAQSDLEMGHAGPLETSLMLHRYPDLVHDDRLEDGAEQGSASWGTWVGKTNIAHDTAEFTENGTVGDPTQATGTKGESLLESAADALVDLLAALEEAPLDKPSHK